MTKKTMLRLGLAATMLTPLAGTAALASPSCTISDPSIDVSSVGKIVTKGVKCTVSTVQETAQGN